MSTAPLSGLPQLALLFVLFNFHWEEPTERSGGHWTGKLNRTKQQSNLREHTERSGGNETWKLNKTNNKASWGSPLRRCEGPTFKFHFGGSLWGPTLKDGANLLAPACIRLGREPLLVQLDTLGMKEDADRRSAFVGTVTPKLQQCVFTDAFLFFICFCLGGAFSSKEGCKQSVCQAHWEKPGLGV